MATEIPTAAAPTALPPYKPWVGVLLSFFVSGLGLFMAQHRRQGLQWFALLFGLGLFWCWALGAILVPAAALWAIGAGMLTLWLWMLRKSYLPIPRPRLKARFWLFVAGAVVLTDMVGGAMTRQIVQPFQIPTAAMSPTLQGAHKDGAGTTGPADHIFVSRSAYWFSKPQRGDVMVFRTEGIDAIPANQQGQFYVKRIVGVPGDRISIRDGRLMNNGKPVEEPRAFARLKYVSVPIMGALYLRQEGDEFEVPTNCYFVVGDNSSNSYDSRFWGTVPSKNVFGRATRIYWPLSRAGLIE